MLLLRGIERRNIFEDNKNRDNMLKRLGELTLMIDKSQKQT
jgi:hypothetical protein